MRKFVVSTAMMLGLAGAAYATDASADDIMATKAAPIVTAQAPQQPATCTGLEDFVVTACPLTWNGITVYGTIDAGVTWMSHGAPFNGTSAVGADYIIQKYSNRPQWSLAPNGLTNSYIGIKGNEPIAPGWALTWRQASILIPCNYPMDRARNIRTSACRSPARTRTPTRVGPGSFIMPWAIWHSSPYGALTVFRRNSLTLDAVFTYDPMGSSYAFSPIGWQGPPAAWAIPKTAGLARR